MAVISEDEPGDDKEANRFVSGRGPWLARLGYEVTAVSPDHDMRAAFTAVAEPARRVAAGLEVTQWHGIRVATDDAALDESLPDPAPLAALLDVEAFGAT